MCPVCVDYKFYTCFFKNSQNHIGLDFQNYSSQLIQKQCGGGGTISVTATLPNAFLLYFYIMPFLQEAQGSVCDSSLLSLIFTTALSGRSC